MFPLSLIFAVFAFVGILLMYVADDANYRKIGLYIFLVFFLLMALQMLVDYASEQILIVPVLLLAIALLMIVLILDLLKVFVYAIEFINNRR